MIVCGGVHAVIVCGGVHAVCMWRVGVCNVCVVCVFVWGGVHAVSVCGGCARCVY